MWSLSSCSSVLVLLSLLNVVEIQGQSCGSPPDIQNGRYNMSQGTDFGTTIIAICEEGYFLIGPKYRRCLNGSWEGRAPLCDVVRCPAPPSIADGQFTPERDSYDYSETVTYTCNGNKSLVGPNTLMCSQDGTFSPDPPQCTACPRVTMTNGYRTAGKSTPPYEPRHYLDFKCNEGYRMEGDSHIVCGQNGWEPPPPTCVGVTPINPPQESTMPFHILIFFVQIIQLVLVSVFIFYKMKRSK